MSARTQSPQNPQSLKVKAPTMLNDINTKAKEIDERMERLEGESRKAGADLDTLMARKLMLQSQDQAVKASPVFAMTVETVNRDIEATMSLYTAVNIELDEAGMEMRANEARRLG